MTHAVTVKNIPTVLIATLTLMLAHADAVSADSPKLPRLERSAAGIHGGPLTESSFPQPAGAEFFQSNPKTPAKQDPLWNGLLIGAGVGALLGLIPDYYDDCEECHDSLYGSIAVGAGVGLLIDFLRRPKASPPTTTPGRVRLTPTFGRGSVGLRGRLAW